HIAIIGLFKSGDVVGSGLLAVERRNDNVGKITDIKWLANKFPVAGYRKDRHAVHEPAKPAQMLAIEPAEHQSWPQNDVRNVHYGIDEVFLCGLRAGVEIIGLRIDHRRGDVNKI